MKKLRIVFANLNGNLTAEGSRILSARLKARGHRVRMVFLVERERPFYSEDTLEQCADLCAGADLVLLTFLSDGFLRAVHLTRRLRDRLEVPLVWGGLHATIAPEACMEHVDLLCRGEGDEALPEFVDRLARGEDYHDVRNFWFRRNGEILRNPMRPLLQDLDSNPWPDYDLEDHFVRDRDDRIKPMTEALLQTYHCTIPLGFPSYQATASRGCAQACAFCYNATFKTMFPGERRLRFRSLEDVVLEIRHRLERFPFFESFSFMDDDFFLRPLDQLRAFADLLREHLPRVIERSFWSCAVTPSSLNREKLEVLMPVGLRAITMGVQTGSERLNREVYNRRFRNTLFYEKAAMLDRHFHKQIIVLLDFLIHCPYETEEDHLETLRMFRRMPRWFAANLYRFTFYPGAPIYERALAEGKIRPDPELYSGRHFWPFHSKGYTYMVHVLVFVSACNYLLPDWLKGVLASRPLRRIGRAVPRWILDLVPWNRLYPRLWAANQQAIYRGREIKHG